MDLTEIKSQVYDILSYNEESTENINKDMTDYMIDKWFEAKSRIISSYPFCGNLVVESNEEIEFTCNDKDRKLLFNDLINDMEKITSYSFKDGDRKAFIDFLKANESSFFENAVHVIPEDKKSEIKDGSKLIKDFKYFFTDTALEMLHKAQDKASEYIQKDKLKGYLCLSVHPVDFLTCSENTSKWDSCQKMTGCYRAGSLSYLLDKYTFIAYVRSSEPSQAPHIPFKWNNKKWRAWMFFSKDYNALFCGRHYPFECRNVIDKINELFLPSFATWDRTYVTQIKDSNTDEKIHFTDRYLVYNRQLYPMSEIVSDAEHSVHYNDLLLSPYYKKPYFTHRTQGPLLDLLDGSSFEIGAEVPCLSCGDDYLDTGEAFTCMDCRDDKTEECPICRDYFNPEDMIYVDGEDVYLCNSCFERNTFYCERCNHNYLIDNNECVYDDEYRGYLCEDCAQDVREERADAEEDQ